MSNMEHELPSHYTLNSVFLDREGTLAGRHSERLKEGTFGEKVVKPAVEIKMEPRVIDQDLEIEHFDSIWKSTKILLSIMGYSPDNYDAKAAIHRGLSFGLQATEGLKQVNVNGLTTEYLSDITKFKGSLAILKGDVFDYLEASPDLAEYIVRCIPDVNNMRHEATGSAGEVKYLYADCVELSAGLVFMLTEGELARIYNQRRATN